MSFRPFQNEFADHRVVLIPADLNEERRARFVAKVAAAVKQQAGFAAKSDAILKVSGEIEQRDDRILIPHEPAAPGDPAALASPPEPPDIDTVWWLSWSLVRALKAVAPGTPHGGIQIATLYFDEAGRIKLGDFGIAPAFEAVCGTDARRQIHCDGAVRETQAGRRCSGVWSRLQEDDVRDHGWIAPYFAHELLEGALRLNPKSDQFAAGALLYLLATGTHPYGASLGDPSLIFYFHLEPFALRDERSDWTEVFERQEQGFSRAADKPVLAWSELVQKLLHSDPGERFPNPAEAEAAAAEHAREAWAEASAAISAGVKLLDAGEVDAFLEQTGRCKDAEALPTLWREQLARWLADIEARKEEIGAYKRLEQRLAEAHEALNNVELERAREMAREVLAAPQCDDILRVAAEELIGFCDEQEQFIQSGADDLAKAYLESAGAYLARNEFDDARHVLNGLLSDPAIPTARAAQARRLIAEVELTEQRIEQQLAELTGAEDDLGAGRHDAARHRLEALLAEESLLETTATQTRGLLAAVARAQAQQAEYAAALDEARTAWERADLEAVEKDLARVPETYAVPEIADVRADLAARCGPLRTALEHRAAAETALAADDVRAALAQAEHAAEIEELPQILHDQLNKLVESCRTLIAEREKQRIARVLAALREAEAACEALRIGECRRRLNDEVVNQTGLPGEVVAKSHELLRTCERIEQAQTLFEHARQHLADGSFEDAGVLLDGLKAEGLPSAAIAELDALRADVARARKAHAQRERRELAARLGEIDAVIDAGDLPGAESALAKIEASPYLTDKLRTRAAEARAVINEQRPLLETIVAAEAALSGDPSALAKRVVALDRLPADRPAWAAVRIEALKRRAAEIAEQRRRETLRRATAALGAAQTALEGGDVAGGRSRLDEAREALELDRALAERHGELSALAAQLEEWLPKVRAAAGLVERGDLLAARREVSKLLRSERIPELCRGQLVALHDRTDKRIAARQQQVDAELAALAEELARRGRRARKFRERLAALRAEPLATEPHHVKADELLGQYERLPEPKTPKAPLVIAGAIVVTALIWAGLYFGGVFGGGDGGEEPPPSVREQIAAALARLQAELTAAAEAAAAQGRVITDWRLTFEPADELPTTLLATEPSEGGRKVVVATASSTAELESLRLTTEVRDQLFPVPSPPPVAERIAAAVKRLQAEVDAARAHTEQPEDRPRFVVRLDPPDGLPTTLIARNEQTEEEIRLGVVEESRLDGLALTETWRNSLYPPPPPVAERIAAAVKRLQAEVDAARAQAEQPEDRPRFVVRLDPPDGLPTTLIARNEQTEEEIRLGAVDEAGLDGLALTQAWRESLYPAPPEKPTVAEVWNAYRDELRAALPDAIVSDQLSTLEDGSFEVDVRWSDRELHPFSKLRFDEQEAKFSMAVASVAEHFRLQIAALEALGQTLRIEILLDDPAETPYEATLRVAQALHDVAVEQVDLQTRSVRVKTTAKLEGDPRSAGAFSFGVLFADGRFAVDTATRSAFNAYLRDLQKHRLPESLRGAEQELKLPSGLRLRGPADFAGGPRVALSVRGTDERILAATDAAWNPLELLYRIDPESTRTALRQAIRTSAQDEATRAALAEAWPEIQPTLSPPADQPGVKYVGRCELLELTLGEDQPDDPFAVAVEVAVGPQGAGADERIRFPARLAVQDGALFWDPGGAREAKATIVARLQALARDADFRVRRSEETLAQLASELGVGRDALNVKAEGSQLQADITVANRRRVFTWSWDNAELRYANRVESAPPAATLADRLEQLASQPTADLRAFRDALAEVTQAKVQRYGAPSYGLAEGFAAAANPTDALIATSAALQTLVAPTPTRDPFPVVFVEHFVSEADVYGLSWRATTDGNDSITGVEDPRVWLVMSAPGLRSYPEPTAFRREYTTDTELGERLLGSAFAEALEGSANAAGGTFGVVIAPDGPLWLTRWEQVRFNARPVVNVDLRGAADPGRVTTLRDLLKPTPSGRERLAWRRAGLWCVPTLAGEWRGPVNQLDDFQLGVLVPGEKPSVAKFRQRNRLTFAAVTDPKLTGDFAWARFARTVRPEEIGYLFWDRGWDGEGWTPTPFTSFALLQIP